MSKIFDDLYLARRTFPLGDRVRGTVSANPMGPGRAERWWICVSRRKVGVDMLYLPVDPLRWPALGRTGLFEVLQHRPGQVQLVPPDAGMRGPGTRYSRWSGREWAAIARRYPPGAVVLATITDVFAGNRECTVSFDYCWSVIEYDDKEPVVGSNARFQVTRHLEWTHRIPLALAT